LRIAKLTFRNSHFAFRSLPSFCLLFGSLPGNLACVSHKLFGTDGIRGTANLEPLTPGSVVSLALAAARILGNPDLSDQPKAVVGRDTRVSGEFLEAAIAAGLASAGVDVMQSGVVPTPTIAYLTARYQASFGVVLSASHNPFEDNGIKFFGPDGYKLTEDQESAIEAAFHQKQFRSTARVGRIRAMPDATEEYVAFALATAPKSFSLRGWKIAIDLANGAAYRTTPLALDRLGADLVIQGNEPNGVNINEGCGSTHPEALGALVRNNGSMLGIAHDGDADRLLFCDELGNPLDGDELLAIAAAHLVRRGELRSNTVAATIMSNFGLDTLLHRLGGKVLRTAVGDRPVIEAMVKNDLNLGGEQSGHLIFRNFVTTGDGLISALQILAIMEASGKRLSELRAVLEKFPQEQRDIPVSKKLPFEQFPDVMKQLGSAKAVLAGSGRVLLRYSGTEPKARLLLEGPNQETLKKLADDIQAEIEAALGP
jgi:phosphoglucosamine mutase